MKLTVFLLPLLLIVLAQPLGLNGKETGLSQQAYLPDIHSALRDMTALMTEQRVELRHTQLELQAVTDRLRDSENQFKAALKTSEVRALQRQKAALKTSELRALQREKAALETLNVRSNATESEVRALQSQNEAALKTSELRALQREKARQVSFSASLLASGSGYTGPYNTETTLVYRHVITNVGNAYNQNTGSFTAPVKGVYLFNFFIHGLGAGHGTTAVLVKNGQHVVIAYGQESTGDVSSSNGASLLLEAGDVVYVQLWLNARIYDSHHHYSTFSGHLLFTV